MMLTYPRRSTGLLKFAVHFGDSSPPPPELIPILLIGAGKNHAVDLARPIENPRRAGVAIDPLEHRIGRIAPRTAELDRRIGRLVEEIGNEDLGHRDFLLRPVALVELPGGMHHQKPPVRDLGGDLAEPDLHRFAGSEANPETLANRDVVSGNFEAALGEPQPAHAVGETRRTEPDLGDAEAVADLHQAVRVGDFEAVEFEL